MPRAWLIVIIALSASGCVAPTMQPDDEVHEITRFTVPFLPSSGWATYVVEEELWNLTFTDRPLAPPVAVDSRMASHQMALRSTWGREVWRIDLGPKAGVESILKFFRENGTAFTFERGEGRYEFVQSLLLDESPITKASTILPSMGGTSLSATPTIIFSRDGEISARFASPSTNESAALIVNYKVVHRSMDASDRVIGQVQHRQVIFKYGSKSSILPNEICPDAGSRCATLVSSEVAGALPKFPVMGPSPTAPQQYSLTRIPGGSHSVFLFALEEAYAESRLHPDIVAFEQAHPDWRVGEAYYSTTSITARSAVVSWKFLLIADGTTSAVLAWVAKGFVDNLSDGAGASILVSGAQKPGFMELPADRFWPTTSASLGTMMKDGQEALSTRNASFLWQLNAALPISGPGIFARMAVPSNEEIRSVNFDGVTGAVVFANQLPQPDHCANC